MTNEISIHTFLAEGDLDKMPLNQRQKISIHTFLAEGDTFSVAAVVARIHFNPHLPRGR